MFKNDLFSEKAHRYVKFRPGYPAELFEFIFNETLYFQNAWDCGTGNGQVAAELSDKFKNIFATDISENQLQNAYKKPNIFYSIQAAEKTNLPENFFDLICCGQSYHWFDLEKFENEAKRLARANCKIAVWGYYLPRINEKNDKILDDFYRKIYGFWEPERKYLENKYKKIYFPFRNVTYREFTISEEWSKNHYYGYLSTWSFLKKFINEKGYNPLANLYDGFDLPERFEIKFPLFLLFGDVN